MKILLLGAAGQVAEILRKDLLKETEDELVLFARNAEQRLIATGSREMIVAGDFLDSAALEKAMKGVDVVYLNDMGNVPAVENIVHVMKVNGVKRLIGASILGIYNEVSGAFGDWNNAMIGSSPRMVDQKQAAKLVEESGLDYTLLRLTWLYNDPKNDAYQTTKKGEPFIGAQISRTAVARAIADIIEAPAATYSGQSLGLSEPGSEKLSKPVFY